MKRAIVTGATGAIGTALVQDLISNGIEVLVFVVKVQNVIPRYPNMNL